MAAPTFASKAAEYRRLWNSLVITNEVAAQRTAQRIMQSKTRYQAVEKRTGVPWFLIAILHMRESSNNFNGVLHNGQKIIGTGQVTSIVPKGRGPFNTWEEAAIDAIKLKGLHKITEWPIERIAYESERYNGWGYAYKGIRSPYVFAGSNHQQSGKYVADHVWDPNFRDTQLGTLTVLKALVELDPSIELDMRSVAKPIPVDDLGPMSGVVHPVTKQVQKRLAQMGYLSGENDGRWGGKTRGAVAAFMLDRGMPGDPEIDDTLIAEIAEAEAEGFARPIKKERAEATVEEVAKKVPEVAKAQKAERTGFWVSISGFLGTIVSGIIANLGDAVEWLAPVKDFAGEIPPMVWIGLLFLASAAIYYVSKQAADAKNAGTEAYQKGARDPLPDQQEAA